MSRERKLMLALLERLHETAVLAITPDGLETVVDDVLKENKP